MNRFFVNEMSGNSNEQTDGSSSEEQSEPASRVQNNVQEASSSPMLINHPRPVSNDPQRITGDPPTVVSSAPDTAVLLSDATRQRSPVPSANLLNSNDEFAVNVLTQLSIERREQRESAVGRNESVATLTAAEIREEARIRNGGGLAMLMVAAVRSMESDPITPNRGRLTLGNMRNRFPRTRLNSVGDGPYSDGEND